MPAPFVPLTDEEEAALDRVSKKSMSVWVSAWEEYALKSYLQFLRVEQEKAEREAKRNGHA